MKKVRSIFFDFESRQDEGRHIGIDRAAWNGIWNEFKGDDCVDQFITWLLDGTHQGAIVIAPNLRGYDRFRMC